MTAGFRWWTRLRVSGTSRSHCPPWARPPWQCGAQGLARPDGNWLLHLAPGMEGLWHRYESGTLNASESSASARQLTFLARPLSGNTSRADANEHVAARPAGHCRHVLVSSAVAVLATVVAR